MELREVDSGSLALRLASPAALRVQPVMQDHRTTGFFIDDILRPDFGFSKEQTPAAGTLSPDPKDSVPPSQSPPSPKELSADKTTAPNRDGGAARGAELAADGGQGSTPSEALLWPAWVYCTRYSDRPSSGPRTRKLRKKKSEVDNKRPRTAFTAEQLQRLRLEFQQNPYITEQRRQAIAQELKLNESQIKIWFQNKRAKIKKATGCKNSLAVHLMAQGLYNHSTTTIQDDTD